MMRVNLDMDGVTANFMKSACRILNEPYPATEENLVYDWLFVKHGREKCHALIRGHDFWAHLEKYPWTDELIDIVDTESRGNWMFLTKPMKDPWCYSGKMEWVMRNYKRHWNRVTIIPQPKSLLASSKKDVLIDDHPKNISEWNEAGGTGVRWVELGDKFNPDEARIRLDNLRKTLIQIRESQ